MSVQSFRYDFTAKELTCPLFKKEIYPECGEQAKKDKRCKTIDGSVYNTNSVPLYIQGRQAKHCFYCFTHQGRGAKFTLTELLKQERSSK